MKRIDMLHCTRQFSSPSGPMLGVDDGSVVHIGGIPYAIGGRFAPPQAYPDSSEIREAFGASPACLQPDDPALRTEVGFEPLGDLQQVEDCRNLTITVPSHVEPDDKLPVMVWIHGGGYRTGAGDAPIHDPRQLVLEQHVILVAITYRLGVFGFLHTDTRVANLGLLDIVMALRWIRRNIASFGGDTTRITLFGQSSGADAIVHLLSARSAEGLFQRVIIQSAPLGIGKKNRAMRTAMGRTASQTPDDASSSAILASSSEIELVASGFGLEGGMPYGIEWGHEPLAGMLSADTASYVIGHKVDVLIGTVAEEARAFIDGFSVMRSLAGIPIIGPLLVKAVVQILTIHIYRRPSHRFARRYARDGGSVWEYVLTWRKGQDGMGAAHTIDLPLLFGDDSQWSHAKTLLGKNGNTQRATVAPKIRAIWANFARGNDLGDRMDVDNALHIHRL